MEINKSERCVILHIPHSVRAIDSKHRDLFYDSDDCLKHEVNMMVDSYVDELFDLDFDKLVFGTSRLLCDVERFRDGRKEAMSKKGMGVCYTKTHNLRYLKKCPKSYKKEMYKLYDEHHEKFEKMVDEKIKKFGKCIIIDCHSFASRKLEYEACKETKRPDICIGLNGSEGENESNRIIRRIKEECKSVYINGEWVDKSFDIRLNSPFSGSIKPLKYLNDCRVVSVMVEVNRYLYMDEITGQKNGYFDDIQSILKQAIVNVDGFYDKTIKNRMEYLSTHLVSNITGSCMSSQLWAMGATREDFDKMLK